MGKRLERFAPLMGVLAVVLWIIAVIISESGNNPADDAPGAEIAAWMDSDSTRILIAATFLGVGAAAFIWFLGSLAQRFRADGEGRLATVVVASGTAAVTMFACLMAPSAAGALAFENLDRSLTPQAAETLMVLSDGFFVIAEFIAVAFAGAAAVAILRGKSFPAWFGWITALLAIVLIVGPIGWAGLIFGIPLWTLITSIWLFIRGERSTAAAVAPA
jgi:MFS family permease